MDRRWIIIIWMLRLWSDSEEEAAPVGGCQAAPVEGGGAARVGNGGDAPGGEASGRGRGSPAAQQRGSPERADGIADGRRGRRNLGAGRKPGFQLGEDARNKIALGMARGKIERARKKLEEAADTDVAREISKQTFGIYASTARGADQKTVQPELEILGERIEGVGQRREGQARSMHKMGLMSYLSAMMNGIVSFLSDSAGAIWTNSFDDASMWVQDEPEEGKGRRRKTVTSQ